MNYPKRHNPFQIVDINLRTELKGFLDGGKQKGNNNIEFTLMIISYFKKQVP